MTPIRGDRLYLRLGAAQARRRLKGVGYGVKRIESAGRGRSAVVHTATGEHLEELRRLLADVLADPESPEPRPAAGELEQLRNLGPASAAWLREAGIVTERQLRDLGAVFVFRLVRRRRPDASLNLLWALEGAIEDIDWREIDPQRKEQLRRDALA